MYMNLEIDVPEKLEATRIRQKVGRMLRSKRRQLESITKLKGAIDAVIAATHFRDGHVSGKVGIENSDAAIDVSKRVTKIFHDSALTRNEYTMLQSTSKESTHSN